MPIQIVIDDVGWWCGADDHVANGPYRTGIQRDHCPDDYKAIAYLGRELGVRPLAAMILAEWDTENILKEFPSATWMGERWDNSRWVGPWLGEAAEVINGNREHFELALHGVGHEYWDNGRMSRAQWFDGQGNMRPEGHVRRGIDYFARIMDQHDLGPFPETFVPTAFYHCFGIPDGGFISILKQAGINFISTVFDNPGLQMPRHRPTEYDRIGFDDGIITVDRGEDLFDWTIIGQKPNPEALLQSPICGMHWPNILHEKPERNKEIVDSWIACLKQCDRQVDKILSPDYKSFCVQLLFHQMVSVTLNHNTLELNFSNYRHWPSYGLDNKALNIKAVLSENVSFDSSDLDILAVEKTIDAGHHIYLITLKLLPDFTDRIANGDALTIRLQTG